VNLGNLARDQTKTGGAIEYHQQALKLSEEITLGPIMGLALAELGWDSLHTGNTQQAIHFFQRALDVGGNTLSPDVKTSIYSGLAEAYEALGDWEKAREYYRLTVESIEKVRIESLTEDRKIGFWQSKQTIFERAISLLYRLREKNPGRCGGISTASGSERNVGHQLKPDATLATARGTDLQIVRTGGPVMAAMLKHSLMPNVPERGRFSICWLKPGSKSTVGSARKCSAKNKRSLMRSQRFARSCCKKTSLSRKGQSWSKN
jgi:tetratricopeptide (TPR) repeat protein